MPIRTVILDFDGTCTDVDREAVGFLDGYRRDLARHLGRPDVDDLWREHVAAVCADPASHGMVIGGRIVAPPVDAYLLATSVGHRIAPDMEDAVTERLFRDNYRFTTTQFRPEAREVVSALALRDVHLHVVTNSDPAAVTRKLDVLAPEGRDRIEVHGGARKFLLAPPDARSDDARFAQVPEAQHRDDWPRPIYLRRGHYYDALSAIWAATGTGPAETLVVGDVYELDLALPGALGCRLHLATGPNTLPYERSAVRALGGSASDDLRAALDALDGAA